MYNWYSFNLFRDCVVLLSYFFYRSGVTPIKENNVQSLLLFIGDALFAP